MCTVVSVLLTRVSRLKQYERPIVSKNAHNDYLWAYYIISNYVLLTQESRLKQHERLIMSKNARNDYLWAHNY